MNASAQKWLLDAKPLVLPARNSNFPYLTVSFNGTSPREAAPQVGEKHEASLAHRSVLAFFRRALAVSLHRSLIQARWIDRAVSGQSLCQRGTEMREKYLVPPHVYARYAHGWIVSTAWYICGLKSVCARRGVSAV